MASRDLGGGLRQTTLSVPEMRCAACISKVERALAVLDGVELARANLSVRRVTVNWRTGNGPPPDFIGSLLSVGYVANLPSSGEDEQDIVLSHLVRAMAVAGFCSMNIMVLSVSVWSGADPTTRQAFHALSAALAVPAVLYSGRTFYVSAARALAAGRTNMDVPVSAGILLAFLLSLYDAYAGSDQAYFEASTSLLFILLVGRTLDHLMRRKARSAVAALASLAPRTANVLRPDGAIEPVPLAQVGPGMRVLVASGDRVPADGRVVEGSSEIDRSVLTGESESKKVGLGSEVRAGDLNLANPLVVSADVAPDDSALAEMTRMLEAAEEGRASYRRLADRAARLYAPVVHGLAALTFLGWLIHTGDLHMSASVAISVLIITCPCALGLAVPIVHVVAAGKLFERGVLARDGSAFERLAEIDTVVFDKTGTLTFVEAVLTAPEQVPGEGSVIASAMARRSKHPVSAAIASAFAGHERELPHLQSTIEVHGKGIEARSGTDVYRLGTPSWVSAEHKSHSQETLSTAALSKNGRTVASFRLVEALRPGALALVRWLKSRGFDIRLLSGDAAEPVRSTAALLEIKDFSYGMVPADKVASIEKLRKQGRKVLMIGDGVNDAPALKAAHVSMAPSSASDIGRNAADFVCLGGGLDTVADAIDTAARASQLIRQNFGLAILYNAVSLPMALMGQVTPLAAAFAMSSSSMLVVANALRLRWPSKRRHGALGSLTAAEANR